jgi:hypothetical protein
MLARSRRFVLPLGLALAVVVSTPAAAQAPSLAGKTVTMLIGFGPGGGYDAWGRVLARHIGRHLPGTPNVVPQNMPGGGSFNAANNIYTIAPKDGSVLGIIARDAALGPLTGAAGARFDPLKISWVGTPTTETNVCIATEKAKVKTVKDLFATELIIGNTGSAPAPTPIRRRSTGCSAPSSSSFPASILDRRLSGVERGEVDGICESLDSVIGKRPTGSRAEVNVLFRAARAQSRAQGVPFVVDMARNAGEKQAIEFLYAGQGIGRRSWRRPSCRRTASRCCATPSTPP